MLSILVVFAALAMLAGCSADQDSPTKEPQAGRSAEATSPAPAESADATACARLAFALQDVMLAFPDYGGAREEVRELPDSGQCLVLVNSVDSDALTIAVDPIVVLSGEAARSAAAKDGRGYDEEYGLYVRNNHEDAITVPLSPDFAGILFYEPAAGESAFGRQDTATIWTTDGPGLIDTFLAQEWHRDSLVTAGALVTVEDGEVLSLLEVYSP